MTISAAMEVDPRISPIFYYFAEHTDIESGRTVGRKIGGVQEIIVRKLLLGSPILADCLLFEQPLSGASGATHKVEFSLHPLMSSFTIGSGERVKVGDAECRVLNVARGVPRIQLIGGGQRIAAPLPVHRSILIPGTGVRLKTVEVTEAETRFVVLNQERVLASIESKRVGAQRFAGSDKLGPGIQTIEKAKQAALVALDLDLQQTGYIKPLATGGEHFVSVVVLGNGVHWNPNDLSVLGTYVDHVFLVRDATIIRYAEFIRGEAEALGRDFFTYFMAHFQGLTKTPDDGFVVDETDVIRVCPQDEPGSLVGVLERHVLAYRAAS